MPEGPAVEGPPVDAGSGPLRLGEILSLGKPGITALIVAVAVGGFLLADPRSVDLSRLLVLVLTGAAASSGAAALNHYLDRDVDARMRRTRRRPLAAPRIGRQGAVAAAGVLLLAAGIGLASFLLNPLTGLSIALGGITYVGVYTVWLKRRSNWNIVVGGFAGSAPALAGSAAATGHWTLGVLAFALLVFLWTPPHFWSLALLLRDDYARAGLPMLPRMHDPAYSGRVVVLSAALLVPAAVLLGATGALAWPVSVAVTALGVAFVAVTWPLARDVTPPAARRGFIFSGPYLLAIVALIAANALFVRWGVPTGW
jgi:heme o synthase